MSKQPVQIAEVIGIQADHLDKRTLEKLGVKLEPSLEQASKRHTALGKILKAIEMLDEEDAVWVLHEAKVAHARQGAIIQDEKVRNDYVAPLSWTVEVVAKAFQVKLSDVVGRRRVASMVLPRQVAMFILWSSQKYSLQQIGDALGGRTPATVSYGFDVVARALQQDESLRRVLDKIKKELL